VEVARALMDVGGDRGKGAIATTKTGDSALQVAARLGHLELVRALEVISRS
jgi:hypothetical protein